MIKIVAIGPVDGEPALDLTFSDGTSARWSAIDLIERDTVLTRPLADPSYFARCFVEGGALAWPNGLELSPVALHASLDAQGKLQRKAA